MSFMQHRNLAGRRRAGSLSLKRKHPDGPSPLVQQRSREGGELEQEGREDGRYIVPREHRYLPPLESYLDDPPDAREEAEAYYEKAWEEYKRLREQFNQKAEGHFQETDEARSKAEP